MNDDDLCHLIRDKLKYCPVISYKYISRVAELCGRRKLATLLLDYEKHADDQVPLLLSMREYKLEGQARSSRPDPRADTGMLPAHSAGRPASDLELLPLDYTDGHTRRRAAPSFST